MKNLSTLVLLLSVASASAAVRLNVPMDLTSGCISDAVSGSSAEVKGCFSPDAVGGAFGKAVLFDGYSTRADLPVAGLFPGGSPDMTFSLWMAVPCYPIVEVDNNTREKATVVSSIDDDAKKGFGLYLGIDGKIEFRLYTGGWLMSVESDRPILPYEWNQVAAVLDHSDRTLNLYINGERVGSTRCNGAAEDFSGTLRFGYSDKSRYSGSFNLQAFNGIIDEVRISDSAASAADLKQEIAENPCDLSIPASRFAGQALRPRFHGMPGAAWTNESHGMIRGADGRYHVFFQKNGNGPYMARLHWGHISSPNLFDWREEPIAFAPGEDYDFKGCWSGCVFADDQLTGGRPGALYTAVDYAKATIALATSADDNLLNWTKSAANPLIKGRPAGLSDDFRDPYFFRNGDKAYVIVGTSKNGRGATTLHRYSNGAFSNDGSIFFSTDNASLAGRFWEMPNITPMGDKWLFTTTPLDMTGGVRTLYWTGSINPDGTFAPDAKSAWPRQVELISKDGYGLLSPTIYQENGKTIVIGIVPDKLPGSINYQLGWAHCYSLPREWNLDAEGNLLQRPYEGLTAMRGRAVADKSSFTLSGEESLNDDGALGRAVAAAGEYPGVHAELLLTAVADSSEIGFRIFKGATGEGRVSIDCAASRLTVDLTGLDRHHNDDHSYAGVYTCSLPELLKKGEEVTLNLFIDGSVLDIFINNRWATSIRVFPTADDALGIEAYATSPTEVKRLTAWPLRTADPSGIDLIESDTAAADDAIYTLSGLRHTDADTLPSGIYVRSGRKILRR